MNNREVTLSELSEKLVAILQKYPELKDKRVSVCTEGVMREPISLNLLRYTQLKIQTKCLYLQMMIVL